MSLEATDFPSDDLQWFVQLGEVGHHQKQVAESQCLILHVTYAYPQYGRCPQCRGQTDQETIAALREGKLQPGTHPFGGAINIAFPFVLLSSKRLHDAQR
jgi:hypothetical protein